MLTGKEKYLFGEIDDCSLCPFYPENADIYRSDIKCNGNPDYSLPCHKMDKYGKMSLHEVVETICLGVWKDKDRENKLRYEEELKKKEKLEKQRLTRSINRDLNIEISRLRTRIKNRESSIESLISLQGAFSFANAMMAHTKEETREEIIERIPQIKVWQDANKKDREKLKELIKERDRRNKERRMLK